MRSNLQDNHAQQLKLDSVVLGTTESTLTGNITLTQESPLFNAYDANGSDRIVTLPATSKGRLFIFANIGTANLITVKDSGGTTVVVIRTSELQIIVGTSTSWAAPPGVFGISGTGHSSGLVPDPGPIASANSYLREDGTWVSLGNNPGEDSYNHVTDGSTTSNAAGDDTFKLRSSSGKVTIAVTSNDVTHGDNANFSVNEAAIDHDSLLNYVANRHVDHTGVSISTAANSGLAGGGTIAATRTLSLDISNLTADTPVLGDSFAFSDLSGSDTNKATLTILNSILDHNALVNYDANRHFDHTGISMIAGTGISGGGTIAASRTFNLSIDSLSADTIATADSLAFYDASGADHNRITFANLNASLDYNSLLNLPSLNSGLDWVNILDFGASTGSPDNTAAIQAAIDYAYANNISTIYVPSGNFYCDDQIFLDPPANLRSSFTNPTIFAFSMALIGDPGLPNFEGDGSVIRFTRNDDVMLAIGPGQGMMVKDLNIIGPTTFTRGQQDPDGVGLGLCGGNGGMTRSRIENVLVANFYTCFATGANDFNALCDSNTFIKCWATNGYYGFYFGETQNFINSLYDCQPGCTVNVYSALGVDIKIIGGNYSATGVVGSYAVGSTSVLTAAATSNSYNYTFTTTITSPDTYWTSGSGPLFNSVAFETDDFGIVPGVITGYAAGVCSIQVYPMWGYTNFGNVNAKNDTDLQANLQACTTAFFGERVTTFRGNNITIDMVHVENPDAPTTLIDGLVGFGSNRPISVKNVFMNFDPCAIDYANSGTPSLRARYMMGAVHFPFFTNGSSGGDSVACDIHLMDVTLTAGTAMLIDVVGESSFKIDGARGTFFNMRSGSNGRKISVLASESSYYNSGSFVDEGHFNGFTGADTYRKHKDGFAPYWGWRPAPYTTPCVKNGDVAILQGSLPAILSTTGSCSYPLLWGGQVYRENDFQGSEPIQFWSDHSFYSYGQNLTTTNTPGLTWTYKGQSHVVYCSDMSFLFPGLGVILNDGVDDIEYVVTGVYGYDDYFTVARIGGTGLLSGTKTVDYTGAVIKQSPFAITRVGLGIAKGRVSSDFTVTSSTALVDVTGLSAQIIAGRTYKFETELFVTDAAAGGIKAAIAGTALATAIQYTGYAIADNAIKGKTNATALATTVASTLTTETSGIVVRISGTITVNASGTLTVQIAQNTSNGTPTTAKRGSYLILHDIT